MNTATSLNMMVKMGAFEKMPKEGSITATELGALINLEPSVIGEGHTQFLGPRIFMALEPTPMSKEEADSGSSPSNENAHQHWSDRIDRRRHLCSHS